MLVSTSFEDSVSIESMMNVALMNMFMQHLHGKILYIRTSIMETVIVNSIYLLITKVSQIAESQPNCKLL